MAALPFHAARPKPGGQLGESVLNLVTHRLVSNPNSNSPASCYVGVENTHLIAYLSCSLVSSAAPSPSLYTRL